MAGQRKALIIANDTYEHRALQNLRSPAADAEALGRVLGDPAIGGFDVEVMHNEPAHVIQGRVESLFISARPEDVLLLHFSCHGLKDESGDLFFAASDTSTEMLGATTVSAEFVQRYMLRSRSRDIVLLLDCCYGGAFPAGVTVRAAGDLNVLDSFPQERPETGRSRIVISATTSMQFALEAGQLVDGERPRPSVFTAAVVKGLATGEADLDEDGWVSVRELYDYVLDQVRAQNPNQTPTARGDLAGRLYLTRSRRRRVRPAPISAALQNAMTGDSFARLGAVTELRALLTGADVPAAAGAYEALAKLAGDDSRKVAGSAREALQGVVIQPDQLTVDFGRVPRESVPPHRTVKLLGPPIALACTPHPSHEWIRAYHEADADELDISIDTSGIGARHGTIALKGPSGEAAISVTVELVRSSGEASARPPHGTAGARAQATGKPAGRNTRKAWVAAAAIVPLVIGGVIWFALSDGSTTAYAGVNYLAGKYKFMNPGAIADDGTNVWVANTAGDSVTELDAANGGLVRVISAANCANCQFKGPTAIADDGTDVWVANISGNSVTELNASNGQLVRVISAANCANCQFDGPGAIVANGGYVWVANTSGNSVTELYADDGDPDQVITGDGLNKPMAIAANDADVWVANYRGNSVTEFSTSSGGLLQVITAVNCVDCQFNAPLAIAADANRVWVANNGSDSVTELNADDGTLAKVISAANCVNCQFDAPTAIADDGTDVWVANADGNSVTELNADNGNLVRVISGGNDRLSGPTAIASYGTHVWVANNAGNSVTELYPG